MEITLNDTHYTIEFGGTAVSRWQKYGKDRLYLTKGEAIDLQSESSLQASHANIANGMWQSSPIFIDGALVGRRTWHGESFVEVRWSAIVEEAPVAVQEEVQAPVVVPQAEAKKAPYHGPTFFHGVRSATLSRLMAQAEDDHITLWGRVEDEDGVARHACGAGELSVTDASGIELSFETFCDDGGIVFVLESIVADPAIEKHGNDEYLLKLEEWNVVGGLRPVYGEPEDEWTPAEIVDQEEFSVEEILAGE